MSKTTVMRASIGIAALVVAIVFAIAYLVHQPFYWLIDKGFFVSIVGVAIVSRVLLGSLTLLHPERPRDTRTFRAAFIKDSWLGARVLLRQPQACLALGASTLVMKVAATVLMIATFALVVFHLPGVAQTGNSFVILIWLVIIVQSVGGSLLLLPEVRSSVGVSRH